MQIPEQLPQSSRAANLDEWSPTIGSCARTGSNVQCAVCAVAADGLQLSVRSPNTCKFLNDSSIDSRSIVPCRIASRRAQHREERTASVLRAGCTEEKGGCHSCR